METPKAIALPDERMVSFLESNTNLTLATSEDGQAWCAHCFYAFERKGNFLVFKSKPETRHIRQALHNPMVAGAIAPDRLDKERIRGIQFRGVFHVPDDAQLQLAENAYYAKYPFARLVHGRCWLIELTEIKMTDHTLGFGKRSEWKKDPVLYKSTP